MRILVTGGTGFLGKNIQENLGAFLNQDYSISTMGSNVYDLRCQHACRKAVQYYNPDVILHAAGSVGGIGANQENPGKFMYDNLIMGANLIERARIENVQKFVLLGTVCAYPKQRKQMRHTESQRRRSCGSYRHTESNMVCVALI
jgi:GDP-L-fucose synthase